ncbi:MAG: AAA family ATPase [Leptospira sp.]|jgi:chromosome partitioning protein|nr:AAA family ATPase [Leptospira sp.]
MIEEEKDFTIGQISKLLNLEVEEFVKRAKDLKIPGIKSGKIKGSVLNKYFDFSDKEYFESHVIAISNQKGGEGKTTISLYLSEALALEHKVLLVDWDPQANATQLFLNEDVPSVMECLGYQGVKPKSLSQIIVKLSENFHLVPSTLKLANLTTPYDRDDFELLKDALLPIRSEYEYIIIDCPPSLGLILENALIAADYILVPIQTRAFSLQGIKDLYETIQKIQKKANQRLVLLGAVLNQYESQKALSGLAEGIKKYFPVFETVIARRESIPQAQAKMTSLSKIDNATLKNFKELANEVKEKLNVKKK